MKLEPYYKSDFSSGQVNNTNPNLVPKSAVELGMNVVYDEEIGSAVSRLGTAIVGAQLQAGMNILGLHQHIDTANSSNNKLFATLNASGGATSRVMDVVAGANLASATGLTASTKMRFLTFLGATLMLNGVDAERSYTAAGGVITTGGAFDLADFPGSNSCTSAIDFLSRVYAIGDSTNPSRLHQSTIATAGAISWAGDYIDIEPENGGGALKAVAKVPGYLLIFKERALHRFNGSSAFPEGLVQIGAPSQEAVVMGGGLCAFYSNSNENAKGFYLTDGGRPIPISHDNTRPIKKWVDAIVSDTSVAGFATDRGYKWSIGDVTVDGEAWTNVWLYYNRFLNQWSVHSYPSEFKVFAQYLIGGVNTIVGGDDAGTVYRVDKAGTYADNGTAIQWRVRDRWEDFGLNQLKSISDRAYIRGKNLEGMKVQILKDEQVDPQENGGAPTIFRKLLSWLQLNTIEGTSFSTEIQGETSNNRAYIREIEIPTIDARTTYL